MDRTRGPLDVPKLKTLFGAKRRPHRDRKRPATLTAAVETPAYDLTWFRVTFGRLGLKAYTKGERVLRIEVTTHNAAELDCGRVLERLPDIIARLAAMAERFCTTLDCTSVGFLSDGLLDELPRPRPARRPAGRRYLPRLASNPGHLAGVTALAPAPKGFTVAEFTAAVHAVTGQTDADYTVRQAAYDLRKLRAKGLVDKAGRSRRYHVRPHARRTITAITTLRDQVLAPLLNGVRSPRSIPDRSAWNKVEHDYEALRVDMEKLFDDLGIDTPVGVAPATHCR